MNAQPTEMNARTVRTFAFFTCRLTAAVLVVGAASARADELQSPEASSPR
jgi:hypothetical protein